MRVEEYVGRHIQARLTALGMTHQAFGEQMGTYLGKPWSRSTVSVAIKGDRMWAAAELLAAMLVTRSSPSQILVPPLGVDVVDFPGGRQVRRDEILAVIAPMPSLQSLQRFEALTAGTQQAAAQLHDVGPVFWQAADAEAVLRQQQHPVVAVIVTSAKGILITRRKDGRPPWGFVTGEIEPGERPEDAAVREAKEEAGLRIRAGHVIGERDHPSTARHMVYLTAHPVRSTKTFVGDESELAELKWVGLAEAAKLLPDMHEPVRAYLERTIGSQEQQP